MLNIPQSLSDTHTHAAYWSLKRSMAGAASSLSSPEFTEEKEEEEEESSTIWPPKKVFHINMDLWVNSSHLQTIKPREITDLITHLSPSFCGLVFGSGAFLQLRGFSLAVSKVCSQLLVHWYPNWTASLHTEVLCPLTLTLLCFLWGKHKPGCLLDKCKRALKQFKG